MRPVCVQGRRVIHGEGCRESRRHSATQWHAEVVILGFALESGEESLATKEGVPLWDSLRGGELLGFCLCVSCP